MRAVGRPVDITFNRSNAPIDPRPWSVRRVRAELRAFRPDVVHVHEPFTPSTAMWATLAAEAPVVATFHTGAVRSRLYDAAAPLIRRIARRIVVRIAVSRVAERAAAARIGGSFEIVPNGVDVGRFAGAEPADLGEGTKLLFVGRLDERKGFPVAVAAFGRLAAERPGAPSDRGGRRSGASRDRRPARRMFAPASRCSAPCPTSTCRRSSGRATSTWARRSGVRASASCWWRRWRQGCPSSRAMFPATTRW